MQCNRREQGVDVPCPVDSNGRFTSEVSDFAGQHVKEADAGICGHIKAKGACVVGVVHVAVYVLLLG